MKNFFIFILISWQLFQYEPMLAQVLPDVRYHFEKDTVLISGGQSFSNKLIVENKLDKLLRLRVSSQNTKALDGLIGIPSEILIAGFEKKVFPLKYIADRKTIGRQVQGFTIALTSTADVNCEPPRSFYTKLDDAPAFNISTDQSEYYLDQNQHETRILLRCNNMGLVPITFRLVLSEVPEGLEFFGEMSAITLQPGAQQVIPYLARSRHPRQGADFSVSIQAMGDQNVQLAFKRLRVMSLTNVRRFGSGDGISSNNLNNMLAIRYTDMNQNSSFYQIQAGGRLEFAEERKLEYRFNMDYYKDLGSTNLYDTFLEYQDNKWGIRAGNIYDNFDYAINGRGIKANVKFDNGNIAEVYGLQNNYMLFSQRINTIPGANIAGANYIFNTEGEYAGQMSYLHSSYKYYGLVSDQLSGKTQLQVPDGHQLTLEGGYSMERARGATAKQGFSGGALYNYSRGNFQINSINYYSTPYYTGLRRGLLQSDTRFMLTSKSGSTYSIRTSLLHSNPKYQLQRNGFFFQSNSSVVNIYELGYGFRTGQFNLDLRPYFMDQRLENNNLIFQYPDGIKWSSSSARLQLNANFSSRVHGISLNSDYGYTFRNTSDRPVAPYHSLRLNANYSNRIFGLSSYMQLNSYYLSDALSATANSNYRMYSFGPNTNFVAFKSRLHVQMAAMYNYYGFSRSKNYSVNSNIRWRIRGNWSLSADVFYTLMKAEVLLMQPGLPADFSNFSNRQIRVGVEKRFSGWSKTEGKKLQLKYFLDANNNGVQDESEVAAAGVTIRLNNEAAVTNGQGLVKFHNLSPGSYTLYTLNNTGWSMQEPALVIISKNKSALLPLVKTTLLKGKLNIVGKSYAESVPVMSGIAVYARDSRGKKYKTLTDTEGRYVFRLPSGQYTVFIETVGMPFSIVNASNEISMGDTEQQLDFDYRDERRKVGIKRF